MRTYLKSRGFTLTPALCAAVDAGAQNFAARFPSLDARLEVRLFDVNGRRGGIDKGCLLHARIGRNRTSIVVSDLDTNLYRAIAAAFQKLQRGTRAAFDRNRAARREMPKRARSGES